MVERIVEARGLIALMGLPNAGKSTLLNYLVGKKVSAISHKAQTTRRALYHVSEIKGEQLIFIDTPGILAPKVKRDLYQSAWGAAQDSDMLLWICDGRNSSPTVHVAEHVVENLQRWQKPIVLAVNKIDLISKQEISERCADWQKFLPQARVFQISAKRGTGLGDLQKFFLAQLPHRRRVSIHVASRRLEASEITREKLLLYMHQELPWQAEVQTTKIEEKSKALKITQMIIVPEQRHRAIFIGKGGSKLKAIGTAARKSMERYFEMKVHLFITVEVR